MPMQWKRTGIQWELGGFVLASCNRFFCTKELLTVCIPRPLRKDTFLLDFIWSFFCTLPYVQRSIALYVGVQQSRCQSLLQAQKLRVIVWDSVTTLLREVSHPAGPRGILPAAYRASGVPRRSIWDEVLVMVRFWPLISEQLGFCTRSDTNLNV